MEEYLCVIRQDERVDWYMLCIRDSFFVLACGCKETIIKAIQTIKRRYRTTHGLREALMNMSEPARCNPMIRSTYESLYKYQKGKYDYLLRDTLEGEYQKIRDKRRPKKVTLVKRKEPTPAPKKVTTPKIAKKPTVARKVMKPFKAKKV